MTPAAIATVRASGCTSRASLRDRLAPVEARLRGALPIGLDAWVATTEAAPDPERETATWERIARVYGGVEGIDEAPRALRRAVLAVLVALSVHGTADAARTCWHPLVFGDDVEVLARAWERAGGPLSG